MASVTEDDGGLRCKVSPMKVGERRNVVEDSSQRKIEINFGVVSGYLVVQEIIQVGFNFKYSDGAVISEVVDSSMLKDFALDIFGQANRHFVLRTSHQYVNVFVETDAENGCLSPQTIIAECVP